MDKNQLKVLFYVFIISIGILNFSSCKDNNEEVMSGGGGSDTTGTDTMDTDTTDTETCDNDNSTSQTNIGCDTQPSVTNEYQESTSGDVRTITTNTYPNHSFTAARPDASVEAINRTYTVDATPGTASAITSILSNNNRPRYYTGISLNGIPLDPAPAEPFIFEDATTGEYNWDWVFEPTNNQTEVSLDCNTAHVGPFGYHYHGDMAGYADVLKNGLGTGSTVPDKPVQIGWAADGFPVFYKYGYDNSGNLTKLTPSYKVKSGNRPGDGVSEPCGEYNGKYTIDYEYVSGSGDLDECNGIAQSITVDGETFSYYYVITDDFPVIPRYLRGTPDDSFTK